MQILSSVPYVFISESIQVLALYFFVYQSARSFKKSSITFLLTELLNISQFKQDSLSASWLCLTFPRKSLDFHCTLCSIYIFC
jgi:hypothetical protein